MNEGSDAGRRVVLGDVAINSTAVSVDPEAEGYERYIIGKHIPENGDRVDTWGPVGDSDFGPRIRTIFQPGDVICTTRGPNLKVARVEFKGLGAHTNFVLRTVDSEVMIQPYLEAVVRSDGFQQHLVNNFRGSVNLFVNWSDAAKYEFDLPPMDEQWRVVEVLRSVNRFTESLIQLRTSAGATLDSAASQRFSELGGYPTAQLGEICATKPHGGVYKSQKFRGHGVPMVNMAELFGNDVVHSGLLMERIELTETELQRYQLLANDLLFGRRSMVLEGAGRCVLVGELAGSVVFESSVLRATIDRHLADPRFVFEWLRSPLGHQQIRRIVTFTTVSGVAGSDVARLPVPLPPIALQRTIARELSQLRAPVDLPLERIEQSKKLSKAILDRAVEMR